MTAIRHEARVPLTAAGRRFDQTLAELFPDYSRSRLAAWIKSGAATLDGATNWQRFRFITYPLLTPIIAVVMTFSVLFTFTDFQLIWAMTRGGPVNATHLMATLSYQRAIIAGQLGEGAAISSAMIPFLLAAIMVSWFGLQRRKWQQGESND